MSATETGPATLALVRHGAHADPRRCAGARHDPPLAPEGRVQATAAAERLAACADVVVTSPARRARQTATAFADEPTVDPRFAERDFGAWEGCSWEALWAEVPGDVLADAASYTAFTPPEAEPMAGVRARVVDALDDWTAIPGRRVLVVTHAGPVRLAVGHALGIDDAATFALEIAHGLAAVVRRHPGGWTVAGLGV